MKLTKKKYKTIGLGTVFINMIFQKLFRINSKFKYMIHFTSRVNMAQNIKIIESENHSSNTLVSFASASSLYMNATNGINFSDDVLIASGVKIISANHELKDRKKFIKAKPITIEKNVWIGTNVVILPEVIIGENSIVAAGSIVTKDVPKNVIVAGNPARVLKDLDVI